MYAGVICREGLCSATIELLQEIYMIIKSCYTK